MLTTSMNKLLRTLSTAYTYACLIKHTETEQLLGEAPQNLLIMVLAKELLHDPVLSVSVTPEDKQILEKNIQEMVELHEASFVVAKRINEYLNTNPKLFENLAMKMLNALDKTQAEE